MPQPLAPLFDADATVPSFPLQVCNMELLSDVRALANKLLTSNVNIGLLVNNASRFLDEHFTVTKEGIEHTIALDYFGETQNEA
jgi:short-subunit dehydrogenase involved in D-alanine esterification of teichoic acids